MMSDLEREAFVRRLGRADASLAELEEAMQDVLEPAPLMPPTDVTGARVRARKNRVSVLKQIELEAAAAVAKMERF